MKKRTPAKRQPPAWLRRILDGPPVDHANLGADLKAATERVLATLTPREREVLARRFGGKLP